MEKVNIVIHRASKTIELTTQDGEVLNRFMEIKQFSIFKSFLLPMDSTAKLEILVDVHGIQFTDD